MAEVIDTLTQAGHEGKLTQRIAFITRPALLIIDEVGYLPVQKGGANLFFQLVNARYERGAIILTSNRGFSEWGEVFGGVIVVAALLDRLLHHAIVIEIADNIPPAENMPDWCRTACACRLSPHRPPKKQTL